MKDNNSSSPEAAQNMKIIYLHVLFVVVFVGRVVVAFTSLLIARRLGKIHQLDEKKI